MMQGIVNLVANHEPYNYGPTYHAESDTFDKVDLRQLRLNAAIVAAVTYGYASEDVTWERQARVQIEALIRSTDLGERMRSAEQAARSLQLALQLASKKPASLVLSTR